MIIGTAGHIDHGKTSLVKALTGIDTDRLAEEKRRGITLELGFAHLDLGNGTIAGVVDVPGHERFVKAMVAGAGGVDLAILVVALDEGVMPQTREHLDICRLLGVKAGVVAVTKADLLPELGEEWLQLLKVDLAALVEGTFLEEAPVIPVSAQTGQGLPQLVSALASLAKTLPRHPAEGPVFLPIDRAFSLKGFGTVLTGTLRSGELRADAEVQLSPGDGTRLRIRGLQVHGKSVPQVSAGQRVAVNVADVEATSVSRGQVLTLADEPFSTRMLDVELTLLPAAPGPLPKRRRLLLHLGTAQVEAQVALLDRESLPPGETGLAQLRLGSEVAALVGQRFVLRGSKALANRGATLAGGRVLSVTSTRRRKGSAELLRPLVGGDAESKVGWMLAQAGYRGLTQRELFLRTAVPARALQRTLELLGTKGGALLVDRERRLYLSQSVFAGMSARALALLDAFHEREPLREGMPKEELRQRLSAELDARVFARLLGALADAGKVEAQGELLRRKGRRRALSGADASGRERVVELVEKGALSPPRVDELAAGTQLPLGRVKELLQVLAAEGAVRRVSDELYFSRSALEGLKERLVSHLREHPEGISTQTFKELVGTTRKFVIPLSEYFDREKVTLRVGDKRVLRRG